MTSKMNRITTENLSRFFIDIMNIDLCSKKNEAIVCNIWFQCLQ